MGEESEEILLQFAEVPTNYALTVRAFDKYFIPKKNVISRDTSLTQEHRKRESPWIVL
jgi:hypothetical protein